LKILIGQSFKNLFSRTEEGIGMKPGTYVPINVDNKCADRKFKMTAIGGERLHKGTSLPVWFPVLYFSRRSLKYENLTNTLTTDIK
jgi:hypothetical protein